MVTQGTTFNKSWLHRLFQKRIVHNKFDIYDFITQATTFN